MCTKRKHKNSKLKKSYLTKYYLENTKNKSKRFDDYIKHK